MENFDPKKDSHESGELVEKAKLQPVPVATKVLMTLGVISIFVTSGIWIGYKSGSAPNADSAQLSLAGLSPNEANFPGAGKKGNKKNQNQNFPNTGAEALVNQSATEIPATIFKLPDDVAGTVISVSQNSVEVELISGEKKKFPIKGNTKVRTSSQSNKSSIKPGDIVTIKPETDKSAKTITILK